MNLRLTALFLALLPCCLLASERPYYVKLTNQLVKKHIAEMEKTGFRAYMTGGGMMRDVKNISVGLELGRTPTLEEARILYVRGV